MKLLNLLESIASEKAKDLGLTSAPFGRWAKNGQTVAVTDSETGDLRFTDKVEPPPKESGPSKKDVEKRQNGAKKNAIGKTKQPTKPTDAPDAPQGEVEENIPYPATPNSYTPQSFDPPVGMGKVVTGKEYLKDLIDPDMYMEYPITNETVIGETTIMVGTSGDLQKKFMGLIPAEDEIQDVIEAGKQDAIDQNKTFRSKLGYKKDGANHVLMKIQSDWQTESQWEWTESKRSKVNDFIGAVTSAYTPLVNSKNPIYRGLRLGADDLNEFLKDIQLGEEVKMPPSGFSINPNVAASFALNSERQAGVFIRLHPSRDGEIAGFHLSHVQLPNAPHFAAARQEFHDNSLLNWEQEVVRSPNAKARVLNVTKLLSTPTKESAAGGETPNAIFIIDMEDMLYDGALTESVNFGKDNVVFNKSMNANVAPNKKLSKLFMARGHQKSTSQNLTESANGKTPAEQAHELGLISAGGPYWMDKTGKIVARTFKNHLVKYESPEDVAAKAAQSQSAPNQAANDASKATIQKVFDKMAQTPQQAKNIDTPQIAAQQAPSTGPESAPTKPIVFNKESQVPASLNGVDFSSYSAPEDWAGIDGKLLNNLTIPEYFPIAGKKTSTGTIIVEPDGRVWVVEPTNHFGGYKNTFPKGNHEEGLTMQENAIKETWEETGLKVKITGFVGDFEGDTSQTRYFLAQRTDGTPVEHGWESQAVKLVPVDQLDGLLNKARDKKILEAIKNHAGIQALVYKSTSTSPQSAPEPSVAEVPPMSDIMYKKLAGATGSNSGGLYEGKDGKKRYVKKYKDSSRAYGEHLANELYRVLGIASPTSVVTGKGSGEWPDTDLPIYASDIVEGKQLNEVPMTEQIAHNILDGFVADVLTANWDVVGLVNDNIIVSPNGDVTRIDNGGTFLFRAMESSGKKPDVLWKQITEWDAFADPTKNASYANIWKAAGLTGPNDPKFRERLKKQVITMLDTFTSPNPSLLASLANNSKGMDASDRIKIAAMTVHRYHAIVEKLHELEDQ
jgi:8-oxo-dGTP pyrophosphatase MutT (NUDIX family)